MKICGIYKITNTVTKDFYIGSSKNVKKRWNEHKCHSKWNECPNNPMYLDMKNYGVDKFEFEILEVVEIDQLKETEQQFIEILKPTYNRCNAKGLNVERRKETHKKAQNKYEKTDKRKKAKKEYQKEYQKTDQFKKYQKEYYNSERGKESLKKAQNKYQNQLCCYNGEILTLGTLSKRFQRAGIEHPNIEAKKYLIQKEYQKEFYKEYNNQLCFYNGETLTLCALSKRFSRAGIPHSQLEAKKYLLNK